ncbi:ATP-binding protein [bacterium]|nr:ATP-binding protein [bacterium]
MIIAVASGKGGTGKTTVATSLARIAADKLSTDICLIDCDVEGPNADIYLKPRISGTKLSTQPVPVVDSEACNICGKCAEVCAFGAIAVLPDRVLIFDDLCMGCGSCVWQCPENALSEKDHVLGEMREGSTSTLAFAQGRLEVGRSRATPIIRNLKKWQIRPERNAWYILDAPPGSACATLEAVRDADFILLVAEPTPLGLHDLSLLVGAVREGLGTNMGVIINRSRGRDGPLEDYCLREKLPILARIEFSREIAAAGAEGQALDEVMPQIRQTWEGLLGDIQ